MKEVRQRKTDTVWYHLYVESKKAKLRETESRMVVNKDQGRIWKREDVGERVQPSS